MMEEIFMLQNPWRRERDWQLAGLTKRKLESQVMNWIDDREIITIRGARQTGKTTLIKQIIYSLIHEKKTNPGNIFYFSFDDRDLRNITIQEPKSIFKFVRQQRKSTGKIFIFLDEIQKSPSLLELVKIYFESNNEFKFIMTGSSSLSLTKEMSETLLGRVISFQLYPLTFQEFLTLKLDKSSPLANLLPDIVFTVENFLNHISINEFKKLLDINSNLKFYQDEINNHFNHYLLIGGYPGVVTKEKIKAIMLLRDIKQTYIERDIIEMLKIEKHMAFSRLIETLSYQIGNLISFNELSKNLGISFVTLKNFLDILENTYIIKLIPPYSYNQRKAVRKNRKVFFHDTGFRNSTINLTDLPKNPETLGHLTENLTLNILERINSYLYNQTGQLNFYRTYDGAEIDFILQKEETLLPIEVKYQDTANSRIPVTLMNFMEKNKCPFGIIITKHFLDSKKTDSGEIFFVPLSLLLFGV